MPRLILLNGPPGSGKSTLAQLFADEHPLALNLDIDRVRSLIGRWREQPEQSGLQQLLDQSGGLPELSAMYDRTLAVIAARPGTVVVNTKTGHVEAAYGDLLAAIPAR